MIEFGGTLPGIRRRVDGDLAQPGMPREKVLATIVHLLDGSQTRAGEL